MAEEVSGKVEVTVHKTVRAKDLGAAKRKARRDGEPWWYDDVQYNPVTVTGAKEASK